MMYKTMVLELLQQRPQLHERLRSSRTMLQTMDEYAAALKSRHEYWMEELGRSRPGSAPIQLSSEAMEFALEELQASLPPESEPSASTPEPPSLDGAMAFIRRHTPPE